MSYDILLYPRADDQDWDAVLAADEDRADDDAPVGEEGERLLEERLALWRRIEPRLREVLPEEAEEWVAEETGGDVFGEMTVPSTGLQASLYDDSASVSFPAGDQTDLPGLHEQVRQVVQVLAEETGYQAYDPQTGDTFDGVRAEADLPGATLGSDDADAEPDGDGATAAGATGVGATAAGAAAAGGTDRPDPRTDPVSLRRRGLLYAVLGVALVAYGLWRWTEEGALGILTGIVLAIGVMDLLGGFFLLSLAGRLRRGEATPTR